MHSSTNLPSMMRSRSPQARSVKPSRTLPPLQKGLIVYAEKRDCFSCHNQAVPLVALEIARARGLAIDERPSRGRWP